MMPTVYLLSDMYVPCLICTYIRPSGSYISRPIYVYIHVNITLLTHRAPHMLREEKEKQVERVHTENVGEVNRVL